MLPVMLFYVFIHILFFHMPIYVFIPSFIINLHLSSTYSMPSAQGNSKEREAELSSYTREDTHLKK
jgi:ABC-type multidrug transport system permease subunit